MTEKELLSQLNNLKNIKPEDTWKMENREILLSQISGGYYKIIANDEMAVSQKGLFVYLKHLFAQPAFVAVAIVVIVLSGSMASISAARNTKPGDSLYIAKIISERTQLAITFGEEERVKLGIEFAGNRAKEISQVLAGASGEQEKAETVGKLKGDIKREIGAVKTRLQKMGVAKQEKVENGEEEGVFSADFGKEENGAQVYDGKANEQSDTAKSGGTTAPAANDSAATSFNIDAPDMAGAGASTTPEVDYPATANADNIEKALNEAENLLQNKDYNGTLDQLDKADEMVSQIDNSNSNSGSASGGGIGSDGTATSTKQ
jgi:hypothetical protein